MIAHFTIQARITRITARSCDAAKIQRMFRTVRDPLSRPPSHAIVPTAARAITVHFVMSCEKRTITPSAAAIQAAIRIRRVWSQPPGPRSIACDESLNMASTVPRWCRDPGAPDALQRALRSLRGGLVVEQPVHRRTGAADVGAEGTQRAQLFGERRGREVVGGERCEIARTAELRERVVHGGAPLVEAGG